MGLREIIRFAKKAAWLLPGFLLWAAFVPLAEKTNVLFALAPLMFATRRALRPRDAAWLWFKNGLLFWVLTLSWMPAIVKNGGPAPLVVLGWGALAAYCALYFWLYGWLAASFWDWAKRGAYWRRLATLVAAEPLLWAGLEIVRSRLGGGFAWNQLGVVAANGGFASPAALGGVYLIGMLIILVNGTLASIAERVLAPVLRLVQYWKTPGWARSLETAVPLAIVLATYSIANGVVNAGGTEPPRRLRAALVQRNFPCVFSSKQENPVEAYGKLVENFSLLKPDIIILSESALAEIGEIGSANAEKFTAWLRAKTGARAVLAGGSRRDGLGRAYNSAALYSADAPLQVYDKNHLVPFGEFIPFDKTFPALQRLAPVGSCTPGEPKLLDFDGIKLGVAICFEDTDSAQIRRMAASGADALVFITNDSWFSQSDETIDHVWQSTARAVETGLPVLRTGNSGVTLAMTPQGVATTLSGDARRPAIDIPGAMLETAIIAPGKRKTPYVRMGDKPIFISFLLLITALVMVKYKAHHE